MNKKFFLIIVFCIVFFSCVEKKKNTSQIDGPSQINYQKAILVYFEGEVVLNRKGKLLSVEEGIELLEQDQISTKAEAYCEIEMGQTALVRIEENTSFSVDKLSLSKESSDVQVANNKGTVLNKVKKLATKDAYRVRTPSTVCGVRGTEFLVEVKKEGNSAQEDLKVAVKKGKVAVVSIAVKEAAEDSQIPEAVRKKLQKSMEEEAVLIGQGQMAVVKKETLQKTQKAVEDIRQSRDLAEMEKVTKEVQVSLKKVKQLEKIDAKINKKLEKIEEMENRKTEKTEDKKAKEDETPAAEKEKKEVKKDIKVDDQPEKKQLQKEIKGKEVKKDSQQKQTVQEIEEEIKEKEETSKAVQKKEPVKEDKEPAKKAEIEEDDDFKMPDKKKSAKELLNNNKEQKKTGNDNDKGNDVIFY